MIFDTFIALVANASMLLGLSVIHDVLALRQTRHPTLRNINMGLLLGLIGLAVMLNPFKLAEGIVFDTRTILLSITGLFFGFIPTLTAVLITGIYRLSMGGGGVYMGVLTIVSSASLGLLWRHLHQKNRWRYSFKELYMLGLFTHICMVALMFTLPATSQKNVFHNIALPVLIIYPFGTVILGMLHAVHVRRMEAEETLKQSEELFNSIANSSPPMWLAGTDKSCYWFNKSWLEFRGRTLEEEQGDGWTRGVHPDDIEKCMRQYSENFDKRKDFLIEYRLMRYDGLYRWVLDRGKPRYDTEGNFLGFVGTCIDQTDLRDTQAVLKTTEEEFSLFFNSAADLFSISSLDGYFLRLNKQWEQTLGYSLDELLSKPYVEFVHPDDLNSTVKSDETLYNGKPVLNFVNRYRHKNGTYRWIEWRAYKVGNRLVAAARDISDRVAKEIEIKKLNRDLEATVAERTAELRQTNEELEAFVSSLGHDLKAPLRAIKGINEILLEDYMDSLDETGKNLLYRSKVNVDDMNVMIEDLMLFSRIKKQQMNLVSIDMRKLVNAVYEELADAEFKKRCSFVVTELPTIKGDKKLLQQMWEHLISNAIKFSASKSEIQITISGHASGINSTFVIKDNGIGFNPRYKAEIFDLFKKLHPDSSLPGTGVGLAIVKKIVQRHKGNIWAESQPMQGAEFHFSLPVDLPDSV